MPPKKNMKIPLLDLDETQKKTPRKRLKKEKQEKPKLKSTINKLKLPTTKSKNSLTNKERNVKSPINLRIPYVSSPVRSKQLQRKIELANEVAMAQLIKSEATNELPNSNVEETPKKQIRGRKVSNVNNSLSSIIITSSTEETDRRVVKKRILKRNSTKTDSECPVVNKLNIVEQTPLSVKSIQRTSRVVNTTAQKTTSNGNTKILRKNRRGKTPLTGNESTGDHLPSLSLLTYTEKPLQENTITELKPSMSQTKADSINSRKASVTSTSESLLSWTKDISSTSTTTCITVGLSDYVRIDGKLPLLVLNKVDEKTLNETNNNNVNSQQNETLQSDSDSSSDKTSDKTTESSSEEIPVDLKSVTREVNLSTSSISATESHSSVSNESSAQYANYVNDLGKVLAELSSKSSSLEMECLNWLNYEGKDVYTSNKRLLDKVFTLLTVENNALLSFRVEKDKLNAALDINNETTLSDENKGQIVLTECSSESRNNYTPDKCQIFENLNNDDDDALSIFAESITGLMSSRRSSIAMSNVGVADYEEYIPQPLTSRSSWRFTKRDYQPTKINYDGHESNEMETHEKDDEIVLSDQKIDSDNANEEQIVHNQTSKIICERQNADSTSINRDQDLEEKSQAEIINKIENVVANNFNITNTIINSSLLMNKPCLMMNLFKPVPAVKSYIFRGVCFFNLISNCKKSNCIFPHVSLNVIDIRNRLSRLNANGFIEEYMMMRSWPVLRRAYGMCFVEECRNRKLTNILVEMAIDFIIKANVKSKEDMVLKVNVVEYTLLYLNEVVLNGCEDLLLYNIGQGQLLCDVFMHTIANSQNFSRFKQVYISLTYFMIEKGRTFDINVTSRILERLCILPYEEPLSRTLLKMIQNTNTELFTDSMIEMFGKHLEVHNKDLYEEFLLLKKQVKILLPPINGARVIPLPHANFQMITNSLPPEIEERQYTSPDTTNIDPLQNKSSDEPIITRTIDFNTHRCSVNIQNYNSSESDSTDDFRQPNMPFKASNRKWKFSEKAFFNNTTYLPKQFHKQISPQYRPMKRHSDRHVEYGGTATKFPRSFGTDFGG